MGETLEIYAAVKPKRRRRDGKNETRFQSFNVVAPHLVPVQVPNGRRGALWGSEWGDGGPSTGLPAPSFSDGASNLRGGRGGRDRMEETGVPAARTLDRR